MADRKGAGVDLTQVLERFPDRAELIRRLAVSDETFSTICEDYALARAHLAKLETFGPDDRRPGETADYRALVADLEREIAEALRNAQ